MFQDQLECYQAIANELVQVAPVGWTSIHVESERTGESSLNTKVVFFREDGSRGSIVDVVMLPRYMYELASLVSTKEKGFYKTCRFVLHSDGQYDVKYEY